MPIDTPEAEPVWNTVRIFVKGAIALSVVAAIYGVLSHIVLNYTEILEDVFVRMVLLGFVLGMVLLGFVLVVGWLIDRV